MVKKNSRILATVYETLQDLHKAGIIDSQTVCEFDGFSEVSLPVSGKKRSADTRESCSDN